MDDARTKQIERAENFEILSQQALEELFSFAAAEFQSIDKDRNEELSPVELELARVTRRAHTRQLSVMEDNFRILRSFDRTDEKEGITRSDLAAGMNLLNERKSTFWVSRGVRDDLSKNFDKLDQDGNHLLTFSEVECATPQTAEQMIAAQTWSSVGRPIIHSDIKITSSSPSPLFHRHFAVTRGDLADYPLRMLPGSTDVRLQLLAESMEEKGIIGKANRQASDYQYTPFLRMPVAAFAAGGTLVYAGTPRFGAGVLTSLGAIQGYHDTVNLLNSNTLTNQLKYSAALGADASMVSGGIASLAGKLPGRVRAGLLFGGLATRVALDLLPDSRAR